MNTYDDYPAGVAYLLSVDGETIGPAMLFRSEDDQYTLDTVGRVRNVTDYESKVTKKGLVLSADHSPDLLLTKLTLDDVTTIFPHTIRKFKSVGSLVASVKKEIMDSNSYTPQIDNETEETISITVDESGSVLELVRADSAGDLYYRAEEGWVKVEEEDDAPTIFDQEMIDIAPEDVEQAIEYYDSNVNSKESIDKEDMLEFAALVQ